jgi:phosphoglycerol transferase MdoB-like AlkP superfamily enzyme
MLSRLFLSMWQNERLEPGSYIALFYGGLRIDLSTVAYLTLPLFLLLIIFKTIKIPNLQKIVQFIASLYIATALCFLVMLEIATPAFILQYDIRPNRLFIEYLEYPQEVFGMLLSGHKLTLLISLFFTLGAFYFAFKYLPKFCENAARNTSALSFYSTSLIVFFCAYLSRKGHGWTSAYQSCSCVFFTRCVSELADFKFDLFGCFRNKKYEKRKKY